MSFSGAQLCGFRTHGQSWQTLRSDWPVRVIERSIMTESPASNEPVYLWKVHQVLLVQLLLLSYPVQNMLMASDSG